MNKEVVRLVSQVFLATIVMGFCMFQLTQKDVQNKELYWGMLCSVLFTFMPHPGAGVGSLFTPISRAQTPPLGSE